MKYIGYHPILSQKIGLILEQNFGFKKSYNYQYYVIVKCKSIKNANETLAKYGFPAMVKGYYSETGNVETIEKLQSTEIIIQPIVDYYCSPTITIEQLQSALAEN